MRAYCLSCRKHAKNVGSWNTTMTNKVIRHKAKCGAFVCLINQDL